MEGDTVYFRRRASEERTAAMYTRHPGARKAHVDMAERYEDLVRAIAARERLLGLKASGSTSPHAHKDRALAGGS